MTYHDPVLKDESINALMIKPGGIFVDATFGGGGHSRVILEKMDATSQLFGFDQDEDVLPNLPDDERFTFVHHNFKYLKRFLRLHGVKEVDGILADLGVSSHQFDQAERGFSYRFDAELDMRMNQQDEVNAKDILNSYAVEDLQKVFSQYGEVRNSKTLAEAIVKERQLKTIKTTNDFLQIVEPLVRGQWARYLSQVFQALRIEVNDEMGVLKTFLQEALEVLKPEGRLVIITYHSIEDRFVKKFLKSGNFEGVPDKDFYGNIYRPFKIITKKPILPSKEEIKRNPRARSASLRVGEKK
ncbi:MAG TPA: 16S rRNA (cytosine(1402)-N(4))-methyltransferase RsmH [Phaeodactylibacter sp.]|nr:16S rRNA (cytosine(1402)-N(4))-methyltransferase RsmH [Phaeodactylibacter sp.]